MAYIDPQLVTSPKGRVERLDVIYDGGRAIMQSLPCCGTESLRQASAGMVETKEKSFRG
jgi:hypothetical protein